MSKNKIHYAANPIKIMDVKTGVTTPACNHSTFTKRWTVDKKKVTCKNCLHKINTGEFD